MSVEDAREIFGLLRTIAADVATIKAEGRFEHERAVKIEERVGKVEERVDALESARDMALGARAALVVASSAIGGLVAAMIQWLLSRGGA